jgi:hypothetical protein
MKKLLLIAAVILFTVNSSCQTFQKGTFIGFHVMTIKLDPNVTLNQFMDFWNTKAKAAYEKIYEGNIYVLKGIRGENVDCFAMMMVWKSNADRDKFYDKDGNLSEYGKAAEAKFKPIADEMAKLGTVTTKYTDWIVQ